jgi:thiamine biosynthesis protein ThiS
MKITLNNSPETIDQSEITISQLLEIKKFSFKMLVIKVNDVGVRKEDYDKTVVRDGDQVIVLHLISGG